MGFLNNFKNLINPDVDDDDYIEDDDYIDDVDDVPAQTFCEADNDGNAKALAGLVLDRHLRALRHVEAHLGQYGNQGVNEWID